MMPDFVIYHPHSDSELDAELRKRETHRWMIIALKEDAGKKLLDYIKAWGEMHQKFVFLDGMAAERFIENIQTKIGGLIHCTWMDGEAVNTNLFEVKSGRGKFNFYVFWAGFSIEEADAEFDNFLQELRKRLSG